MRNKKLVITLVAAAVIASIAYILIPNAVSRVQAQDSTGIEKAIAVIAPTEGNKAAGVVTFTQTDDGVSIEAHITGLTAGQEHGFHIHQYGDLSKSDGTSAGGHFNPGGENHAGPDDAMRHTGDLGNIKADADGHAMYKRVDKHASLDMSSPDCIIGRGVVVHGGTDDLKSQPAGDAGPRIGHGVIGVANPE